MKNLTAMTFEEMNSYTVQNAADMLNGVISFEELRLKRRAMDRELHRRIALFHRFGRAALQPGFAPPRS
jgi:hypothetical protein